jgi:hypothetical protein
MRVPLQLVDEEMALETRQRDCMHTALLEIANRIECAQLVFRRTGETGIRLTALAIESAETALDGNIQSLKRSGHGIRIVHFAQHVDACKTRHAADHAERTPSHHRRSVHSPSLAVFIGSADSGGLDLRAAAPRIESVIAAPIRI